MSKDPIEQAEEVLRDYERHRMAEVMEVHGQMILVSSLMQKPTVQGGLLLKASSEGSEYMSGMLVALGLTARNWGRALSGQPDIDFREYIDPENEANCSLKDDGFAHKMLREILSIEKVEQADRVRGELMDYHRAQPERWGRMTVHLIGLYTEILNTVLSARNGDEP